MSLGHEKHNSSSIPHRMSGKCDMGEVVQACNRNLLILTPSPLSKRWLSYYPDGTGVICCSIVYVNMCMNDEQMWWQHGTRWQSREVIGGAGEICEKVWKGMTPPSYNDW